MRPHPDERGTSRAHVHLAALQDVVWRKALSAAFQPIVDLRSAEITGYEGLIRLDKSGAISSADKLFNAAEQCNLLEQVESLARETILGSAGAMNRSRLLFLNFSPAVLSDPGLVQTLISELEATSLTPPRLVLEITERSTHEVVDVLSAHCLTLRERGFSIALDDVGAGVSGLNRLMSLRPNWIKLDSELVANIDLDPLKQNLIRFFVHFAQLGNMRIIAEGIERKEELRMLVDLGVTHGQGYFLGRPGVFMESIDPEVRKTIVVHRGHLEALRLSDPATVQIKPLLVDAIEVSMNDSLTRVRELLRAQPHQPGVVVVGHQGLIGWIPRDDIEGGRHSCPDSTLWDLAHRDVTQVDLDSSLSDALEQLAARVSHASSEPIVVLSRGRVAGIVPVRQVLLAAADAHRRSPSHNCPLTGFPTRVQADRWLNGRMAAGDQCDVAFIDLANFAPYNLAYGFERGDQMLIRLASLIRQHLIEQPPAAFFAAHLGEDRFMAALPPESMKRVEELMRTFESTHSEFFSAMDLASQGFCAVSPRGARRTFALTAPRVIYLRGALGHGAELGDLYAMGRQLRERTRGGRGDGVGRLIVERFEDQRSACTVA